MAKMLKLRIIYVVGLAFLFFAAPHIGEIPFALWGIGFPAYFIRESFRLRKQTRSQASTSLSKEGSTGERATLARMRKRTSKVDSSRK